MASQSSSNGVPNGFIKPWTTYGDFNNLKFIIQQALLKMETATLVQIVSCTNSGGLSEVGFVDVLPLVNQIDGQGNPTPHEVIHNIPYLRVQGGSNAVIIDPVAGDIGICCFASRDISKVKTTKSQANPGSYRDHSFADGLYMGGVLNGMPIQYIQFYSSGINIHSPNNVTLSAPVVNIDATVSCTINTPIFTVNGNTVLNGTLSQGLGSSGGNCQMLGPLTVTNDVTAVGTSLHKHKHKDVESGSSNTGEPV